MTTSVRGFSSTLLVLWGLVTAVRGGVLASTLTLVCGLAIARSSRLTRTAHEEVESRADIARWRADGLSRRPRGPRVERRFETGRDAYRS